MPLGLSVFSLVWGAASWLNAATIAVPSLADTTISQSYPDNNLGGESFLQSGLNDNAEVSRALLKFDIAGNLPANATIQRVTLTLTVAQSISVNASFFSLHRALQPWGEGSKANGDSGGLATSGEATWNARSYPATLWSVPGATAPADYVAAASASQYVIAEGSYSFSSNLLADVQSWFTNSAANFGWFLISEDEGTFDTFQRFASREDAANAPRLIIDYTLPPRPHVTLTPVADTSLFENAPDNNLGAASLVSGTIGSSGSGKRSRALIRFLPEGFPAGATLTSATLGLTLIRSPSESGATSTFDLHRMVRPWEEGNKGPYIQPGSGGQADPGETTWEDQFAPSFPWSAPGAAAPTDFAAAVSSTTTVSTEGVYYFTNLLTDVQFWLAHPEQNFGWIVVAENEISLYTARHFGSREDPNPTNAPALVVEYIPVPRIDHSEVVGNHFNLSFVAPAGLASTVQYRDTLATNGVWLTFTNLLPSLVTKTNVVSAPFSSSQPQRFYRVGLQ